MFAAAPRVMGQAQGSLLAWCLAHGSRCSANVSGRDKPSRILGCLYLISACDADPLFNWQRIEMLTPDGSLEPKRKVNFEVEV